MTIIPLQAAPQTTLPPAQVARAQDAAQKFEAMAINQFLAPMFETVDSSKNPFSGGAGETAWRPFLVDEMAKSITRSGGLGIARPVLTEMLRMQEAKNAQAGAAR